MALPIAAFMMAGGIANNAIRSPDGVHSSGSGIFDMSFDGSGWVVATGGGGAQARALPTVTSALQSTAGQALGLLQNPIVILGVIAGAYIMTRNG